MVYTPPRSTFHHTVWFGLFVPIGCVLIHVVMSLSTALPALYQSLFAIEYRVDCVAVLFLDKSSANISKMYLILIAIGENYVDNI